MEVNAPYFVFITCWLILCIVFSLDIRYFINSSIVPIFKLYFFANASKSFFLAMVPSSFKISTITDDGSNPANLARSHPASVCPALLSTPPFFAMIGKCVLVERNLLL